MAFLVNPSGRIVQVDKEKEIDYLLSQMGFRRASDQEETEFVGRRSKAIEKMNYEAKLEEQGGVERAVYIATVGPGGKDGYGVASEQLITNLRDLGINISTYKKVQKIGFLFHSPQSLIKLENPVRIIYTMFESDKIPDEWLDYLQLADKVYVPSKWCADVFKKSGVPAEVVPLGYDDTVFTYKERRNKRDHHETFNFIHYNAFNVRKGFLEVFNAFKKAFEPGEPVKLILKTNLPRIPIPITPEQYPNIEIVNKAMQGHELRDLLYTADCMIFPSRGEGFGIPPLEAMATGIPAIVPNAHGITEYFNTDYMYEAKVAEMCPALYTRYKGMDVGQMIKVDEDQLAQQMRYVYEHQDEAIDKGKRAAEYVKQWTFRKTAEQFADIFKEWMDKTVEPKTNANILMLEEVI
jgi:glycosyltransferase involved in cell wall biosynthesis